MVHALKLLKMKLVLLLVVAVVMKCFVPWSQSARNQRRESRMRSNRGRYPYSYARIKFLTDRLKWVMKAIQKRVDKMKKE